MPWTSALLCCVILTGQQASGAESGYPPPPGAYRIGPAAQFEPTRSSPQATSLGADFGGREPTQRRSRQLPLPDDMFGTKPGSYDADNLFGSSTPGYQALGTDPGRGRQPPPATRAFHQQGGPADPDHPSYAPGYPAYPQQYQRPYYGGATPETLPGAPALAPPPNPGDSSVFRPPE